METARVFHGHLVGERVRWHGMAWHGTARDEEMPSLGSWEPCRQEGLGKALQFRNLFWFRAEIKPPP